MGVDLDLVLSAQHPRRVDNASTVSFDGVPLQLPATPERAHYVRCEVTVHEFPEGTLGISYLDRELAPNTCDSQPPRHSRQLSKRQPRGSEMVRCERVLL